VRLVLTGAAGLLGSHLLGALDGEHEVVPLDRLAVDHPRAVTGDLTDLPLLERSFAGARAVLHFAGASAVRSDWEAVLESNVVGMRNVLEAARRSGVERVIWASSNHAVGGYEMAGGVESYRGGVLVDRSSQPWPDSLYGVSKLFGEALARWYSDAHGLRTLGLRIGACVPDDDWEGIARRAAANADDPWLRLPDVEAYRERFAAMFLSRRDLVQLVRRGLEADYACAVVFGVSANPARFHDLEEARRVLGYVPQDAARVR
jgi:NAD+ dependent glucose-6-phosphate dehydrogenase